MGRFTLGKIIAITNQKGGVGKTTTAVNLSACMAALGKRVLLVDIDPQGNATSGLGKNDHEGPTVYDVLIGEAGAAEAVVETGFGPLSLIPTAIELAGAEIELVAVENREQLLKDALAPLRDGYDYIFIDCPPTLDMLTINALVAANSVIIPIQCEFLSLEGLVELHQTIKRVRETWNAELEVEGILFTMCVARYKLTEQIIREVKKHFPSETFNTVIPRNIAISEAPSFGEPVIYYEKKSKGAKAYEELAKEMTKRSKKKSK